MRVEKSEWIIEKAFTFLDIDWMFGNLVEEEDDSWVSNLGNDKRRCH